MAGHMTHGEDRDHRMLGGQGEGSQEQHELSRGRQTETRLLELKCGASRLKRLRQTHSEEKVGGGQQRQAVSLGLLQEHGYRAPQGCVHTLPVATLENKANENSWDRASELTRCQPLVLQ